MISNSIDVKVATAADYANLFGPNKLALLGKQEYYHRDLQTSTKMMELPYYKFSVIRNPIEKFKSAFLARGYFNRIDCIDDLNSYERFYQLMEKDKFTITYKNTNSIEKDVTTNQYKLKIQNFNKSFNGLINAWNNWFRFQRNFIDDSFKLWKFEKGFDDEFYEWFNQLFNFNLDINVKISTYLKNNIDDKVDYQLPNKLIKNIEKYYCDDMELWESLG